MFVGQSSKNKENISEKIRIYNARTGLDVTVKIGSISWLNQDKTVEGKCLDCCDS